MKRIYEAANNVEAHMLVHLLAQAHIEGHVLGEHLQSGGGELPLGGLVAVAVQDEDAAEATRIIREWEARTATPADASQLRTDNRKFLGSLVPLVVGALIGAGVVWSIHHGPDASDGVDWNGDGKFDERAYFDGGVLDRIEYDRNFDGRVDAIDRYELSGTPSTSESDDDFDGRFETRTKYRNRQPDIFTVDADGDGDIDFRTTYEFGAPTFSEYLNTDGKVVKRVEYRGLKPQRALLDYDADGEWERKYRFDRYDEPAGL